MVRDTCTKCLYNRNAAKPLLAELWKEPKMEQNEWREREKREKRQSDLCLFISFEHFSFIVFHVSVGCYFFVPSKWKFFSHQFRFDLISQNSLIFFRNYSEFSWFAWFVFSYKCTRKPCQATEAEAAHALNLINKNNFRKVIPTDGLVNNTERSKWNWNDVERNNWNGR